MPRRIAEDKVHAAVSTAARPLVAMTQDAGLVAALEELSGQGVEVTVVDDDAGLAEALLSTPHSIALIDSAASVAPIVQLIDSLAAQFPDTRLLAAGNSLEQGVLATRIASQRVYRFVHKPASAQRLKLFYDAASRPMDAARSGTTQSVEVLRLPADAGSGGSVLSGRNRTILIVAVALLTAGGAWLYQSTSKHGAPVSAPATKGKPVDALVQRADQAFAQSNFVGTEGTSASELYKQALDVAGDDERARSGYTRSVEYGLRSIEDALTLGQLDAAEQRIAAVRAVAPRTSRLDFLASQLTRARDQAVSDATRRNASEGRQSQLHGQIQDANDALRRGALLEPVDGSAVFHLRNAERIAPGDAQVIALRAAIATKLLAVAESNLGSGQSQAARRLLDAAVILGAETGAVDRLRRQADRSVVEAAATAKVQVAAAPAPEPAAPAPVAATPEPAPAAEANAKKQDPAVVSAATLQRVRTVDPEFPTRALVQGISGWVEMEFTVARDGAVRDVAVRKSEPAQVFDTAAMNALRRWRFAPVLKDGQAVEQRAWIRMRFTARDE